MNKEIPKPEGEKEKGTTKFSPDDLQRIREGLAAKLEEVKQRKEEDLKKKFGERELLLREAERINTLQKEARTTAEYFGRMKTAGELQDPADVRQLEELEALVTSLKTQEQEIDKRLAAISKQPEVLERLHETAQKEYAVHQERKQKQSELKNALEQAQKEFTEQIDELVKKIEDLPKVHDRLSQEYNGKFLPAHKAAHAAAFAFLQNITNKIKIHYDSDAGAKFLRIIEKYRIPDNITFDRFDPKQFEAELLEYKGELKGFFKGKYKKAADSILKNMNIFETYEKTRKEAKQALDETDSYMDNVRSEGKIIDPYEPLVEEFQGVRKHLLGVMDKLRALGATPEDIDQLSSFKEFTSQLAERLRKQSEDLEKKQKGAGKNFDFYRWRFWEKANLSS